MSNFIKERARHLQAIIDRSRKGEIDTPIRNLVKILNSSQEYFTTSSCSGRIILLANDDQENNKRVKKGCEWLLVSHEQITASALSEAIQKGDRISVLKFEAFILHVRCASLDCAKKLLSASVSSGFRNSGLSIGKAHKITLAVRSSLTMEVPLSPKFPVSFEYLNYVVEVANKKMEENFDKIERFEKAVANLLNLDA